MPAITPGPPPADVMVERWQHEAPLASMRIGSTTAAGLLPRQVQIAFAGSGPLASRAIVPLTDAASALLSGAHGAAVQQSLRGMLGTLDATGRLTNLKGITIADSADGWLLNSTMREMEGVETSLGSPLDSADTQVQQSLAKRIADRRAPAEAGTWVNALGWVNVGTKHSPALLRLLQSADEPDGAAGAADRRAGSELALGLAHELAHSESPDSPNATREPGDTWLEEGAADVLSVARAPQLARAMGLPFSERDMRDYIAAGYGYTRYRTGVERLLNLAGIDPAAPDGAAQAERLLQDQPDDQLSAQLTGAIVRHNMLSPDVYHQLKAMIVTSQGAPQRITDIEAFARGAGIDLSQFGNVPVLGRA